jgi:hypothetical protein
MTNLGLISRTVLFAAGHLAACDTNERGQGRIAETGG